MYLPKSVYACMLISFDISDNECEIL